MIKLHDKYFEPYIDASQVKDRVAAMAAQLTTDYEHKNPLFIAVLNGAFIFAADLLKGMPLDVEISFVKLTSYQGLASSGNVSTVIGLDADPAHRHVIILEDIVDTGRTLQQFLPVLQGFQPASIKIATLLYKQAAMEFPLQPDYTGFSIPDKFVVGYGLDYNGLGRNLPGIYRLL